MLTMFVLKRFTSIIVIMLALEFCVHARSIPLDSVYINGSCAEYKKLLFSRLDYYQSIGAQFIDSNTIFVGWLNGKDIIYIKELGNTNFVIITTLSTRKKYTVFQFKGTLISARISANGLYIAIKYFNTTTIPKPILIVLNTATKVVKEYTTASAGIDYSFSDDGNSFYYKSNNCIVKVLCDSYWEKEILCNNNAPQWDENTMLLDHNNYKLFISGSSGFYNVFMQINQSWQKIFTTITPAEVFIANKTVIYTGGFPGNYTVNVYSLQTGKTQKVLLGSFNPSLHVVANTAIFLNNAFITLYNCNTNKLAPTTIESDEAILSPDQFSIASIVYNRLFILPTTKVIELNPQAKRYLTTIQSQYTALIQKTNTHLSPYTIPYIKQKKSTIDSLLKLF